MYQKFYFYWFLAFLFTANIASGQTLRAYEKAADEAMEKHDYYNAVHYYEIVLKSKKEAHIFYKYGNACRLSYAYKKAEEAYKEVLRSRERRQYPKAGYYYALSLKHNGIYDAASREFTKFLKIYTKEDFIFKKATQEIESCKVAKQLARNPIDTVEVERLGDNINTKYSDFGGHEVDDKFYYSSLRFERKHEKGEKRLKETSKRLVSKLLSTGDKEKETGKLNEELNLRSKHTGNSAISPDGKRLYFTYCEGQRSDSVQCEIYVSTRVDSTTWSTPKKLPPHINMSGATTTHPNIGWDNTLQKYMLFFASDRKGGQGMMDIWYSVIDTSDFSYGEPVNLGSVVNTIDDEVTPFFHTSSQTLYFSSRWHYGMGGLDIFSSQREDVLWMTPKNVGVPLNSAANDLYYLLSANDSTGYFASNRAGSKAITGESCCNDIYQHKLKVEIIAPLDTPITSITEDSTIIVQNPEDSVIIVQNPEDSTIIVQNPEDSVIIAQNPEDSTIIVQNNPENPNTSTTGGGNTPPNTDITDRIEELNKMLPLTLYFHNDEPDSNTTSTTTNKPYSLTYNHYLSLIDEYKEQHSNQFDVEKQPEVQAKVGSFFENDVKGEFNRMNDFFAKVLGLLDAGAKLEIYIKGYTSPRTTERYNQALARRRITSVRKQLFIYQNGAFLPHFQKGHFEVHEVPLGESTVPKGVPDAIDDPKNSIYSVEASRERRAEIMILQKK